MAANRKKAANVPFALGALVSIMAFPVARGAEPTDPCDEQPPYKVGCTIRNPATGELEEIYRVPPEGSGVDMVITRVTTASGTTFHAIWTTIPTVGMEFPDPDPDAGGRVLVITDVLPNADPDLAALGLFDRILVRDREDTGTDGNPPTTWELELVQETGDVFDPGGPDPVTTPPDVVGPVTIDGDNRNLIREVLHGTNGANGKDGGGLRVCIIWCFTIGVDPAPGSAGSPGPTINRTVDGPLEVASLDGNLPGIWVASFGGNGGKGGDAYSLAGVDAREGGAAGNGGNINLTVGADVVVDTAGDYSHGIYAQSMAGRGGSGGTGFSIITGEGGTGGPPARGGNVVVTNHGDVETRGEGAIGLYAQSLGGGGGEGGNGWGIVGTAGSASQGGNGGNVEAINAGRITTWGERAHGVVAQSIGGSGGDGGRAGGIGAIGGGADMGGDGGRATARNLAGGTIITDGATAFGMLVQSIGGGGGYGGDAAGIASVGGGGEAGGNASQVEASNAGAIETHGEHSFGILAQSIGGGGGAGGSGAGPLATIGGTGGTGGQASAVTVRNEATGTITTRGEGASAIVAQSIGGGGGTGGSSTSGVLAVGGTGGAGGSGSTVNVSLEGQLRTERDDAKGVLAQSIGGGGGSGGSAASVNSIGGLGIAIGGKGGAGGTGGTVNLQLGPAGVRILTSGDRSTGLYAQSVGGGGGNGGGAVSIAGGLGAASIGIGGQAGTGQNGGTVSMTTAASSLPSTIHTQGDDAAGVFLQSVGGGGGNGGYAVALSASVSASLSLGVGGRGSAGGAGGRVLVGDFSDPNAPQAGFRGQIITEGERSTGLLAQSVGGGGGNGGFSMTAAAGVNPVMSGSLALGLGGDGGSGGDGGNVDVAIEGDITTLGSQSAGLVAQSIGGGGGNGGGTVNVARSGGGAGAVAVTAGVGGQGSGGGHAGTVNLVTGSGTIRTEGENSTAIVAQSIGGGGGNGGYSINDSAAVGGGAGASLTVGIGGDAGAGGTGNAVNARLASDVVTLGQNSTGVLVQSVGGGGGNGGFNVSGSFSAGGVAGAAIGVGLGGTGGAGSHAGNVDARSTGNITTLGDRAAGFVAQSIGGGGGNGGSNVTAQVTMSGIGSGAIGVGLGGDGNGGGDGGNVLVRKSGDILTRGAYSTGLLAQSVGGGGGNGGGTFNVTLAGGGIGTGAIDVGLGGSGGTGGNAGTVDVETQQGNVVTTGDGAAGIVVQSIGGGGGNGGYAVQLGAAVGGIGAGAIGVGLGGSGGDGGDGDDVEATLRSNVETQGDDATGVLVQSVGGGGGNGGFNITANVGVGGVGSGAVAVGLGGSGAGGGSSGNVRALSEGTISTWGDRSSGFVAQSIGGGGGNGGFNVTLTGNASGVGGGAVNVGLGGDGGAGGSVGTVWAHTLGNVHTRGAQSVGVLAQSVGGGGGNGGFNVNVSASAAGVGSGAIGVGLGGNGSAGANGNTVDLVVDNDVITEGDDSDAIVAQSIGGGGGNGGFNVTVGASGGGTGSGAVAVGLGGRGDGGGNGARASSTVNGNVYTLGAGSTGVLTQSVGGGGGNGGFNIAASLNLGGVGGGSAAVGLGGSGAGGGDGGAAHSIVNGNVLTVGADSGGIVVQSLGGGGGNGGLNVSGAVDASGTGGGAAAVGLGGSGGGGGSADTATAEVTGNVGTQGARSNAVTVQSIGGGGGNGGINISAGASLSGQGGAAVSVGLGGSGGSGGDGGAATAQVTGDVETTGDESAGVLVQSVGGGGGAGGVNVSLGLALTGGSGGAVAVGLGGSGGGGGSADTATATVTGHVSTTGRGSTGVVAQSVGGGGGSGGINVSGGITASSSTGGSLGVGIGGFGGTGGFAGTARTTLSGNVETQGDDAGGVLVQSVGGGGGNGGINVAGAVTLSGASGGAVSVGVGGFGGDGGDAAWADAHIDGNIATAGANSHAVAVQSIGGGGGNGGINVSGALTAAQSTSGAIGLGVGGFGGGGANAGAVTGVVNGELRTSGEKSYGLLAQSLGGGGGNGGLNVSGALNLSTGTSAGAALGVGGFGGGGGHAGDVDVRREGSTITSGANSHGIVAQSLGGGGGNGGINIAAGIAGSSSGSAYSGALGVGGFGGNGGSAGNVALDVTGDVLATGLASDDWQDEDGVLRRVREGGSSGVLAQSIGGSGGNGGLNVSGGIALAPAGGSGGSNALSLGVGGFGGDGGSAGNVNLTLTAGSVHAIGDRQSGVAAQSIGGGGGNGGINVSGGISMGGQLTAGVGGFGGGGGTGGDVFADVAADITVAGADVVGFLAESIGGGGGNGGINVSGGLRPTTTTSSQPSLVFGLGGSGGAGNTSGNVQATQAGRIMVEGEGSTGVLAQSIGGGGGNGGLNVSGSFALARRSNAAAIGIGGFGGDGANAGAVTLASDGEILVDGRAHDGTLAGLGEEELAELSMRERGAGILAQSIGGGGGNGGVNATGVLAPSGNQLAVGVGGWGGGGGHAGAVSVQRGLGAADRIVTAGNFVSGLVAQSIGGGGGNAGINIVFEAAVAGAGSGSGGGANASNQAIIAIGGDGGAAGHGAAVDVRHAGGIVTLGDSSHGLIAQSLGGGGGNANINFGKGLNRSGNGFSLAVGGAGANGGNAGVVTVQHAGDISTLGDDATAIFAQSVGGGGGNAEADDSLVGQFLDAADLLAGGFSDTKKSIEIEIGRSGGIGGDGADVSVTSSGTLDTHGARAVGIRAQSIGAGGGVSTASSVGVEAADKSVSVQVGVGGAEGGRGGAVSVVADGAILTRGKDAHAIHAQSVGGGGGAGGSVSGSLLPSGNSVSVGVGGVGGEGGVAGTVTVANAAGLTTLGEGAHGIHAQSIGGGGGDGGFAGVGEGEAYEAAVDVVMGAIDGSLTEGGVQVNALVGGNGGEGALADAVTVDNSGSILTVGRAAHGINAQSIGGGGGVGGMVMAGTVTLGSGNNSLGINVGGEGGDGSGAGDVSVTNEGVVRTVGDESVGIRAQSLGGGGGDAGLVAVLNVTPIPGSGQMSANVNIGGKGGEGASAGDVTVANRRAADGGGGTIVTDGASSHGIFAQSLGGGGGNGSSVVQLNFSTDVQGVTAGLSIGGSGGDGGTSGDVVVTNEAHIETHGAGAHGVFAQSIGGGGGNGGLSIAGNVALSAPGTSPLLAVGGEGGTGSTAGDVVVNNSGTILTVGENANGILAQSIGGGGGNAGIGIPLSTDVASVAVAGVLSAALGGKGGDGGLGGNVTVNHSGDITVLGHGAQAVVAESINGGGGGIALDFNGITSLPGGSGLPDWFTGTETDPVFVLGIGGENQRGAGAGLVTLNYTGTFGVAGDHGAGSRVQAIGGGGGNFDFKLGTLDAGTVADDLARIEGRLGGTSVDPDAGGNRGGDIDGVHQGDLLSEGHNTPGVLAQSIGGGGGRANVVVASQSGRFGASSFVLGSEGGSDDRGGDITHAQQGSIRTSGTASHGSVMQSVGGGGGLLSFIVGEAGEPQQVAASQKLEDAGAPVHARAATPVLPAQSAPLALALGATGGSAQHGGNVQLALEGDVITGGAHSVGLLFQSIGGGGGLANVVGASSLEVVLGGAGGAAGNGGALDVANTGNLFTAGEGAHGVLLQSIGGGGGAVLSDVEASVVASAGNSGDGGAIRFSQAGDIRTEGARSWGLIAQSIGGGGGFVDGVFAGSAGGTGAGGTIDLTLDGNVFTLGEGSTALFAQSTGTSGGGNIEARLTAGHYILGGAGGTAVHLDGGAANRFENDGVVQTLDGIDGAAFIGSGGSDLILNRGVVVGNVDLGDGANAFTNAAGATFYSAPVLSLGAASNLFTNEGRLEPGAQQRALVTQLSGSFVQAAGGVSQFELDFLSGVVDSVAATGTAQVGGEVNVSLLNVHVIPSGTFVKPLYTAAGGITNAGLAFNPQRSAVIDYRLLWHATSAEMEYTVDFSPPGVKGNRNAIGDWFNRVQAVGSSPELADLVTRLVLEPDLDTYADLLTQLGPELYAEQQAYTLRSGQAFGRSLRNCGWQNLGRLAGDAPSCTWVRVDLGSTDRDPDAGTPDSEETLRRYAWGFQFALERGLSVGFGLALDDGNVSGYGDLWSGGMKQLQAGASLRRNFGRWSVGGLATLGKSSQDAKRAIAVTDPRLASGDRSITFGSLLADASYRFDFDGFVVTPGLALGGALLDASGMAESGAHEQSLVMPGYTDVHLWAEPSVNVGLERAVGREGLFRAYARLGMLGYLNGARTQVRAGLAGGPEGVTPMRVKSDLDAVHLLAEGGVEYLTAAGLSLGLNYTAERSDLRSGGHLGLRFALSLF